MEKHTDRILELKSIYYSYHNADGETPAITDLSFSVNESEFIAIVGPVPAVANPHYYPSFQG